MQTKSENIWQRTETTDCMFKFSYNTNILNLESLINVVCIYTWTIINLDRINMLAYVIVGLKVITDFVFIVNVRFSRSSF